MGSAKTFCCWKTCRKMLWFGVLLSNFSWILMLLSIFRSTRLNRFRAEALRPEIRSRRVASEGNSDNLKIENIQILGSRHLPECNSRNILPYDSMKHSLLPIQNRLPFIRALIFTSFPSLLSELEARSFSEHDFLQSPTFSYSMCKSTNHFPSPFVGPALVEFVDINQSTVLNSRFYSFYGKRRLALLQRTNLFSFRQPLPQPNFSNIEQHKIELRTVSFDLCLFCITLLLRFLITKIIPLFIKNLSVHSMFLELNEWIWFSSCHFC